ncbi:helix-turn-helix transcriptional regulator [Mycobacterium sherrisii]|uniref:helix-turn-helix transcriptional regulator n=1 Tax=Mycobacterium sherrisii TaxID=243061 RepID=UPI000A16276D|nr:helix-turn-helix transcriptional regulator [Mycobacterium sherrisii]MCV7029176.1 helix-turn-helix domain-containing protein [Mycobacterium sherrisii]MEC4763289.1 helix-turn-helix transcriptional regulator [Mycobacterium sherrisii]ORW76990.1 DNA-binding protein [Mycobacterium sherrisii]
MTERSALAQFLRARRSLVQPADVGLPAGGRRRVAGLRREEVAILANISTDYYLRLEQGREEHPSDQVLTALSRALKLDDDAVAYMRNLTRHRSVAAVEPLRDLHPGLQGLIDGWPLTAAHVVDPGINTVVANNLAAALSPYFGVGFNTMRELFGDPAARNFYRNWKPLTEWAVSLIRVLYGQRPDPALIRLVDDLIEQSPRFRQLWERHDVRYEPAGVMLVNHPRVGKLTLNYQQMILPATGHVLVSYWAEPRSESEDGMRRLSLGVGQPGIMRPG